MSTEAGAAAYLPTCRRRDGSCWSPACPAPAGPPCCICWRIWATRRSIIRRLKLMEELVTRGDRPGRGGYRHTQPWLRCQHRYLAILGRACGSIQPCVRSLCSRPPKKGCPAAALYRDPPPPSSGAKCTGRSTASRLKPASLRRLRDAADLLLDTSDLPLAALRAVIEDPKFGASKCDIGGMTLVADILCLSAKGLPRDADLVFDMRFLRNPHYDPILRPRTGLDPQVAAYVEADPDFEPYLCKITDLLRFLLPRFVEEGKKYANIAIGCTGGRHRSRFIWFSALLPGWTHFIASSMRRHGASWSIIGSCPGASRKTDSTRQSPRQPGGWLKPCREAEIDAVQEGAVIVGAGIRWI